MQLLDLPDETLLIIFSTLSLKELSALSSACRRTYDLFKSSSRLLYNAELEASGCEDLYRDGRGTSSGSEQFTASIPERLKYLRDREARWRELNLLKKVAQKRTSDLNDLAVYDLTAGVLAYGDGLPGSGLTYLDLREVSRRSEAFTLNQKHERDFPEPDVPWQSFPFQGCLTDFGMALQEHDLIAVVSTERTDTTYPASVDSTQQIKLHLLCFSTHQPHPCAKESVIKLTEKAFSAGRPSPAIEVAGKYIIVFLTFPRNDFAYDIVVHEDLFVYNWQTGLRIAHHTYNESTYSTLSFITPSLFVLPNLRDNTLDLVHIGTSPENIEQIFWLRKLALPELKDGFTLANATCRGDPNLMHSTPDCMKGTHNQKHASTSNGNWTPRKKWGAFGYGISADPLKAIISFSFAIDTPVRFLINPLVNMVVHRYILARLALDSLNANGTCSLNQVPSTKWEDWGEGVTGWRLEDAAEWVTTTAGQRQVFLDILSDLSAAKIVVRDYNPYTLQRMKHVGPEGSVDLIVDSRDGSSGVTSMDEGEMINVDENDDEEILASEMLHEYVGAIDNGAYDGTIDANERIRVVNVVHGDSKEEENQDNSKQLMLRSVRVRDTTHVFSTRLFKESVSCALPCVDFILECAEDVSGVLIDEERIITYLNDDDDEGLLQVSVFSMHP